MVTVKADTCQCCNSYDRYTPLWLQFGQILASVVTDKTRQILASMVTVKTDTCQYGKLRQILASVITVKTDT